MEFRSLPGLVPYSEAHALQLELVEKRALGEIPDTVLFLEHESVVTRGRGLQWTGVSRDRAMPMGPLPAGMAYAEIERGGDLTWHGPGQLVIYPILKLDGQGFGEKHDVAAYIRRLEKVLVDVLARYEVRAGTKEGATGVWVSDSGTDTAAADSRELSRKIASIGIAVRKWVTYHGIGLNIVNDLKPFHAISPCGFSPEVMTRLQDVAQPAGSVRVDDWRVRLEEEFTRSFRDRQRR